MNTVAATILQQLGGGRFIAMTGAKEFRATPHSLSFRLPWPKVNHVCVALDPSDTYTVDFSRVRAGRVTNVGHHENVYFDDLQRLFTEKTGLATHL